MTLAEILAAELARSGVSLNELARNAEQSPGRVHAILSGETKSPGILTVKAIVDAMGRTLAWLDREMRKEP